MKFHAMALCVAGALVTGIAASADSRDHSRKSGDAGYTVRDEDAVTGTSRYSGEWIYHREVLWPNLPPKREVAAKVSEIIQNQRHEVAMLRSLAPQTRTAGYTNISTVYEHMANDHEKLAGFASEWLRTHNFPVPAAPTAMAAANTSPEASVDDQIRMHQEMFEKSVKAWEGERSSTVRTLHLWAATGSARHISLLRTLDQDVERGRKTLSARLQAALNGELTVSSQTTIVEEELAYLNTLSPLQPTATIVAQPAQVIETERVVERIVERPVERVVERRVEVPVERIVERVVERPVYRERTAGRRQMRRPAK